LSAERAAAGQQLREIGERARGEIERRIADLREREAALANERDEQERLLAVLVENERPLEPEPEPAAAPVVATDENHALAQDGQSGAAEAAANARGDVAEPPAQPHFSTVTFTTAPSSPRRDPPHPPEPSYEDHGPDFRSLLGNIFTRRKPEEPIVDEGPSISERIARDFGLLGVSDEDEEAAETAATPETAVAGVAGVAELHHAPDAPDTPQAHVSG